MKPLVKMKKPADLSDLGPRMRAVKNEMRRQFVWHYCQNGGNDHAAYRSAGYQAVTEEGERISIFKLMHSPDILAAIGELGHHMVTKLSIPALAAVGQIVNDPNHKDRLRAAMTVLDRTGFASEHKVTVEHISTDAEMVARVKLMAEEMGVDPEKLLGRSRAEAIDGEFTEVVPALPAPDLEVDPLDALIGIPADDE